MDPPPPLTGLRVVVTRARGNRSEDPLGKLLRESGATPVHVPLTRTVGPRAPDLLRSAVRRILSFDWILFTSPRAVAPFMEEVVASGLEGSALGGRIKVAAVGPATAAAARSAGLPPDLIPERFTAEGLAIALLASGVGEGARILLPRAEEGRDVIPLALEGAGARVEVIPVYATIADPAAAARLVSLVETGEVDVLTFAAGSAARSFAASWDDRGVLPAGVGLVALGPATARVLERSGMVPHLTANPHTLEGMLDAVRMWARSGAGGVRSGSPPIREGE